MAAIDMYQSNWTLVVNDGIKEEDWMLRIDEATSTLCNYYATVCPSAVIRDEDGSDVEDPSAERMIATISYGTAGNKHSHDIIHAQITEILDDINDVLIALGNKPDVIEIDDDVYLHNPTFGQLGAPDYLSKKPGSSDQPYWRTGANPTVDMVAVNEQQKVLLIKRSINSPAEPGKWALPGGFHDTDAAKGARWQPGKESAPEAAVRELVEETTLDVSKLIEQLEHIGFFDDRGRDERNNEEAWAVSNAFRLNLTGALANATVKGMDDADDAGWFTRAEIDDLDLAFDHRSIIERAFETEQ